MKSLPLNLKKFIYLPLSLNHIDLKDFSVLSKYHLDSIYTDLKDLDFSPYGHWNDQHIYIALQLESLWIGFLEAYILPPEGELFYIGIHKNHQNQNYGFYLLNCLQFISQELSLENLFLEVSRSNSVAICFYQKHGFSLIAHRRNYYSSGDDALILKKGMTS